MRQLACHPGKGRVEVPALKEKVGWAEAIQAAFRQEADEVPPEWKTLKQVAAELGMNPQHVCKKMARLIKTGRAEVQTFRTWSKGGPKRMGYLRSNRHYRLVEKPAKKQPKSPR